MTRKEDGEHGGENEDAPERSWRVTRSVVQHVGVLSESNETGASVRQPLRGAGLPLRRVAADEGHFPAVVVKMSLRDQALV